MINLRPAFAAILACLFAMVTISAVACGSHTAALKPSGLPTLLAFSSGVGEDSAVYTIKPDGTGIQSVSGHNRTLDSVPTWTPDGSRILFTSGQSGDYEIWSMDADGSDRRQITHKLRWDGLACVSPDGSKIAFVGESMTVQEGRAHNIYTINSDGTDMRKLTGVQVTPSDNRTIFGEDMYQEKVWNSVPTWSPDGKKILFGTTRGANGSTPVLYTMNADGSDQQRFGFIFPVDGTDPVWSPVTNKIVFVRGSSTKGEIWVMDGGSPFPGWTARKITANAANNHSPVWSPDGMQIAFLSDIYGNDNIFIMNADGTSVRRLTDDKYDSRPSWR